MDKGKAAYFSSFAFTSAPHEERPLHSKSEVQRPHDDVAYRYSLSGVESFHYECKGKLDVQREIRWNDLKVDSSSNFQIMNKGRAAYTLSFAFTCAPHEIRSSQTSR